MPKTGLHCTTAKHQLPLRTSLTAWILTVNLKSDGPRSNRREPVRALPAPLGAEAAEHAGAEELPEMQKPLLEPAQNEASPRQPRLAQGRLRAGSSLNAVLSSPTNVATALTHQQADDHAKMRHMRVKMPKPRRVKDVTPATAAASYTSSAPSPNGMQQQRIQAEWHRRPTNARSHRHET